MSDDPPPQHAGFVTVRNPTRTVFFVNVNGETQYRVDPDDLHLEVVRLPRSVDGNASDGKFGWDNRVDAAPESAGSAFEPITLKIPRWLQTAFDLELLIFFRADPTIPDFLLHWGGLVIDYELGGIAVTAASPRPAGVTPLHGADTSAALKGSVS